MEENNPTVSEIQAYRTQHRDEDFWTPPRAAPTAARPVPAEVLDMPQYRGRFQKGFDPRRHQFTTEECQRGFWAAIDSIVARYPEATLDGSTHICVNFLRSKRAA